MNKFTHTPEGKTVFWLISLIWFGLGFVFTVAYYSHMLKLGAYPYGADSIAIPIGNNFLGMLVLLPFFILLIFLITRNYVGGVSFLVWNKERHYWSAIWTLVVFTIICIEMGSLPHVWQWKLPTEFIKIILNLWFFLLIRAVVVSKSNKFKNLRSLRSLGRAKDARPF